VNAFLLDCGPLVALLDKRDSLHQQTRARFAGLTGILVTTGPVITEAMFLVQDLQGGPNALCALLDALQVQVEDVFDQGSLAIAADLMAKYENIPMDFADASLVLLASRLANGKILTWDERGFGVYRYGRGKTFKLCLLEK
jgi:uncharacterized protein